MNLGNFLDLCSTKQSVRVCVHDGTIKVLFGTADAHLSLIDDYILKNSKLINIRTDPANIDVIEVDVNTVNGD